MGKNNILEVRHLKKYFTITTDFFGRPTGYLKAVDDVSFSIGKGETLGLVGESGCGKSTTGRTIIRLYQPTGGEIWFNGELINNGDGEERLRRSMQMIFQDPYASLNPRMTVGDIIGEPLDIHRLALGGRRRERIVELLQMVGLNPEHANRFPHEFSGGQRQRIGIARALAINPSFIICDEGVSALDVSIQAQVINLLKGLQQKLGLTYLFIAHDLAMVKYLSDHVAVMYLGKIVEIGETREVYSNPKHPYTQALLSAIPVLRPGGGKQQTRICLVGDIPSPMELPIGCRFHTRCSYATAICTEVEPTLQGVDENHRVACHLIPEI